MLFSLERKIKNAERKHDLSEVTAGDRKLSGVEAALPVPFCVVSPKFIHFHELGILLMNGQIIIIVFGPLLGRLQLLKQGLLLPLLTQVRYVR